MEMQRNSSDDIIKWQQDKNIFIEVKISIKDNNAVKGPLTLDINVSCPSKNEQFVSTYNNHTLPTEAKNIFNDVQGLFDYIQEHHMCKERIYFQAQYGILRVVNIVVLKGKQRRQQVQLKLIKKVLQSKNLNPCNNSYKVERDVFQFTDIKEQQYLQKVQYLMKGFAKFQEEITFLKKENNLLVQSMNNYNVTVSKLQFANCQLMDRVDELQKKQKLSSSIKQPHAMDEEPMLPKKIQQELTTLKKKVDDNSWHIDQINIEMINKKQQEKQKSKENPLQMMNLIKKDLIMLNNKVQSLAQTSRLGEKIFVTLDLHKNQHMSNYRIIQNIVEKVDGDQQRFQILGQQIINKPYKTHYEVKVISSINGGVILGVVCNSRRGERHSFDKKQCVCYDGKGFIFEQGQKIKMPCKFDNGQTIRVVVDPKEGLIQWYVGYTQIGSTHIPESLKKVSLVPYIQMFDINDKIAING